MDQPIIMQTVALVDAVRRRTQGQVNRVHRLRSEDTEVLARCRELIARSRDLLKRTEIGERERISL